MSTVMSTLTLVTVLLSSVAVIRCDYMVNVYPEFLKIGDITNFDPNRWMGKNGLDKPSLIPYVKQTGAIAARWVNTDFNGDVFVKAPEDPNRKGYPDPAYFRSRQQNLVTNYLINVEQYNNTEIVVDIMGLHWPNWTDTSKHNGRFPNNIDAAAEFVFLLVQAIVQGSHGKYPVFFEGMNEPDWETKNTDWTTFVTFYQAFAQKIKSKYPIVKVGGPTYTDVIDTFDKSNFTTWKKVAQFLDMALTHHFDFFCFHTYGHLIYHQGNHEFHHDSEAKVFGLLDMVESYAYKKRGKPIDAITSEYGLSGLTGLDHYKPSTLLDWGYIYQHNVHLFTFLERRDVMKKAIAFLMSHATFKGQWSINYSILDKNHHERDVAHAFKFWKDIHNTMIFLRVDSQFHGAERKIIPHALVDKRSGSLVILLHNHDKKPTRVKLGFGKGWFNPTVGKSTCEYLGPQNRAVLEVDKPVHVTNSVVTVPAEASCYFKFHTTHDFSHAPTVTQKTYYSTNMIMPIHNVVDVKVNIPTHGNVQYARLRIGISLTNKAANPKPRTVQLNNHLLTSFYSLHTQNRPADPTWWQTYEYNIPVNVLLLHNDVKLMFAQSGGHVCTVAIDVGQLPTSGTIIG